MNSCNRAVWDRHFENYNEVKRSINLRISSIHSMAYQLKLNLTQQPELRSLDMAPSYDT